MISTVHRAKGLQWKRVKVANDFRFKTVDGRLTLDEDEMRLLYVAVTRAQHVLSTLPSRSASPRAQAMRRGEFRHCSSLKGQLGCHQIAITRAR